jgi:hypothetical protein
MGGADAWADGAPLPSLWSAAQDRRPPARDPGIDRRRGLLAVERPALPQGQGLHAGGRRPRLPHRRYDDDARVRRPRDRRQGSRLDRSLGADHRHRPFRHVHDHDRSLHDRTGKRRISPPPDGARARLRRRLLPSGLRLCRAFQRGAHPRRPTLGWSVVGAHECAHRSMGLDRATRGHVHRALRDSAEFGSDASRARATRLARTRSLRRRAPAARGRLAVRRSPQVAGQRRRERASRHRAEPFVRYCS